MGKAHEPNVQRDPIEDRREPGQLTPDGGDTPVRDLASKQSTNLEQTRGPGPAVPPLRPPGPDVHGVHERRGDDKSTVAEPDDKHETAKRRQNLETAAARDKQHKRRA